MQDTSPSQPSPATVQQPETTTMLTNKKSKKEKKKNGQVYYYDSEEERAVSVDPILFTNKRDLESLPNDLLVEVYFIYF